MAITLSDSATPRGTSTTVTSLASNALAGTPPSGQLLVVAICLNEASSSDPVLSTPSGWTAGVTDFLTPNPRTALYWKIAGASEPTSVTISWSLSAGALILGPYSFAGVNTSTTLESAINAVAHGNTSTPSITGAASSTDGSELIVAIHGRTSLVTGSTPTGGFTLAHDGQNTNAAGTRCGATFCYKILTSNETSTSQITLSGAADSTRLITGFHAAAAAGKAAPFGTDVRVRSPLVRRMQLWLPDLKGVPA